MTTKITQSKNNMPQLDEATQAVKDLQARLQVMTKSRDGWRQVAHATRINADETLRLKDETLQEKNEALRKLEAQVSALRQQLDDAQAEAGRWKKWAYDNQDVIDKLQKR